jgi:hypothetical protein
MRIFARKEYSSQTSKLLNAKILITHTRSDAVKQKEYYIKTAIMDSRRDFHSSPKFSFRHLYSSSSKNLNAKSLLVLPFYLTEKSLFPFSVRPVSATSRITSSCDVDIFNQGRDRALKIKPLLQSGPRSNFQKVRFEILGPYNRSLCLIYHSC